MPSQYQRSLPSGQTTAGASDAWSLPLRPRSRGRPIRIVRAAAPRRNSAAAKSPAAKARAISERNGRSAVARACAQCGSPHFQYFSAANLLAPRRPHRRRRLRLEREQRRTGGQVGRFDRVQVHGQPLRPAQPRGAVRRPLALPEPPLDRNQRSRRRTTARVHARPEALGRRERAIVVERPALEHQVRAAADVRLQRADPLDPAQVPAQRRFARRSVRSTPSASTTGGRANAFLTPALDES